MTRLYYHSRYPGVWLVVIKEGTADELKNHDGLTAIYQDGELIGVNLFDAPRLADGYHRLGEQNIAYINERLVACGLPRLAIKDNPIYVGRILNLATLDGGVKTCQIDLGFEMRQIVTKAANVYQSQKVAVALPGAVLHNGDIIEANKLYGKDSQGVLVSKKSLLGLEEDIGNIIEIGDDLAVGALVTVEKLCGRKS